MFYYIYVQIALHCYLPNYIIKFVWVLVGTKCFRHPHFLEFKLIESEIILKSMVHDFMWTLKITRNNYLREIANTFKHILKQTKL